jgi:IS1 family transposase
MCTPAEEIEAIVRLYVEGCSVRSIERITDTHRDTILRVLVVAAEHCERLFEDRIRQIPVKDVQCDEMWGFVGCKEKRNVSGDPRCGDPYCLVAIERHTKVILAWHLGRRTERDTAAFTEKPNEATSGEFQITTDAFSGYFQAIHMSLGTRVDYAQLIKVYGTSAEDEHRYSPARVLEVIAKPVWGQPDADRICPSHIERQNLTMRMHIRRLTRLTNAFSKKWDNLKAALAIHLAYYNFCRAHQTPRVTPAMEAGLTSQVWKIAELLALDTREAA